MKFQLIECRKIEFPIRKATFRSFKKEIAEVIADSIRTEGLYHPIVVRPNPTKEGFYLGVQGKHRHYAKFKILKEKTIPCNVLILDDQEAEMAGITENLFRHELSQPQKTLSIKRWFEIHTSKYPDASKKGAAGGRASGKARSKKQDDEAGDDERTTATSADDQSRNTTEGTTETTEGVGDETTFTKKLAAATGVSGRTARREQKLAESLTEDQLEVCEQMGITKTQMEALAGIKDERQKGEIFNLLATGMPFDQAWDEIKPCARKATNKSKDAKAAQAESALKMTDDVWFDTFCGEKAAMLGDPSKFRTDAILYREITEARAEFRSKIKAALKRAADTGLTGPLHYLTNRIVCLSHPKDFLLCGKCGGKCHDGKGGECPRCRGAGYTLNTENYF